MRLFSARTLTIAVMLPGVFASSVSAQNTQTDRTIEQYTCKDIMREEGSNRDSAIAFLHGFLLGKSGASKFNVEALEKQTDAFIERCLDNPQEKAQDAMLKVKG
jgi:hypothetical protein